MPSILRAVGVDPPMDLGKDENMIPHEQGMKSRSNEAQAALVFSPSDIGAVKRQRAFIECTCVK